MIGLALLLSFGVLASLRTLPEATPTHLAVLGLHGLVTAVWVGARLARAGRGWPLRIAGAALALLPYLPAMVLASGAAPLADTLVVVDRAGSEFGPGYPGVPQALFRTPGDPGTRELYLRRVYFGWLLGWERTPFQG